MNVKSIVEHCTTSSGHAESPGQLYQSGRRHNNRDIWLSRAVFHEAFTKVRKSGSLSIWESHVDSLHLLVGDDSLEFLFEYHRHFTHILIHFIHSCTDLSVH